MTRTYRLLEMDHPEHNELGMLLRWRYKKPWSKMTMTEKREAMDDVSRALKAVAFDIEWMEIE